MPEFKPKWNFSALLAIELDIFSDIDVRIFHFKVYFYIATCDILSSLQMMLKEQY